MWKVHSEIFARCWHRERLFAPVCYDISMVERGPKNEPIQNTESLLSKAVVEGILDDARRNLAVSGGLSPTLFVQLENGERSILPLSLPETHPEKRIYFSLLGMSFIQSGHSVREAILVSESWIITQPESSSDPFASGMTPTMTKPTF